MKTYCDKSFGDKRYFLSIGKPALCLEGGELFVSSKVAHTLGHENIANFEHLMRYRFIKEVEFDQCRAFLYSNGYSLLVVLEKGGELIGYKSGVPKNGRYTDRDIHSLCESVILEIQEGG